MRHRDMTWLTKQKQDLAVNQSIANVGNASVGAWEKASVLGVKLWYFPHHHPHPLACMDPGRQK